MIMLSKIPNLFFPVNLISQPTVMPGCIRVHNGHQPVKPAFDSIAQAGGIIFKANVKSFPSNPTSGGLAFGFACQFSLFMPTLDALAHLLRSLKPVARAMPLRFQGQRLQPGR